MRKEIEYENGIVVGRFQPFHNGHLQYVLKALEQCNTLYIGITTPGETATEYEPDDPNRLGPKNNPFTFDERKHMITLALKERHVDMDRIHFVPYDPTNVDEWYKSVPEDAVYFLLLTDPSEQKKVAEMQARGLEVVVLDQLTQREHMAGSIRQKIAGGEPWEHFVSKSVADYLEKINAKARLTQG